MKYNIKGAIFDMDGTLINSLILWDLLWEKFGRMYLGKENFRPAVEDDKKVRTMTLDKAMEHIHNVYNMGDSGEDLLKVANELTEDFYANEVCVKDGVIEFLEDCLNSGIKMCIASATELRLVKIAAKHCGLEKYFSHILSCADIGKGKDCPDIFLLALDKLGTKKEETFVFEDSALAIETANKAGISTIGVYDEFNYGQDIIKNLSVDYIADGESFTKLI